MARRRSDRVVAERSTGAVKFVTAREFSRPRSTYRDFKEQGIHDLFMSAPSEAVYLDAPEARDGLPRRKPSLRKVATVVEGRRQVLAPSRSWRFCLYDSRKVQFCVKRKYRREVMFAAGVAGRRRSTRGSYRRSASSSYGC